MTLKFKFYNIQWVMGEKTSVTEFEFTSRVLVFFISSWPLIPTGPLVTCSATMPRVTPCRFEALFQDPGSPS